MLNKATLMRGALRRSRIARYSPAEVRKLLDPSTAGLDDRRGAVLAMAAVPGSWTDYLPRSDASELGRVAARLPTVIFWHRSGLSLEAIGDRLGIFGGSDRADRALEVAAGCIAASLNDRAQTTSRALS